MVKNRLKIMKGGGPNPQVNVGTVSPGTVEQTGGSVYARFTNNIFLKWIFALSIIGILWFIISRSLIRHKYSEVLCYGLMSLAILVSMVMLLISGVKKMKGNNTFFGFIKKIIRLIKYLLYNGTPALLILVQLAVLIGIMSKNADYLYINQHIPVILTVFNTMAAIMVIIQIFVWRKVLRKIIMPDQVPISPYVLPGFILAFLLSGIAISQIYIILEFLKTDC